MSPAPAIATDAATPSLSLPQKSVAPSKADAAHSTKNAANDEPPKGTPAPPSSASASASQPKKSKVRKAAHKNGVVVKKLTQPKIRSFFVGKSTPASSSSVATKSGQTKNGSCSTKNAKSSKRSKKSVESETVAQSGERTPMPMRPAKRRKTTSSVFEFVGREGDTEQQQQEEAEEEVTNADARRSLRRSTRSRSRSKRR